MAYHLWKERFDWSLRSNRKICSFDKNENRALAYDFSEYKKYQKIFRNSHPPSLEAKLNNILLTLYFD